MRTLPYFLTILTLSATLLLAGCSQLNAHLIGKLMDNQAASAVADLDTYAQTQVKQPIEIHENLTSNNRPQTQFDVLYPRAAASSPQRLLPLVVWVHGGGWVGGNKEGARSYLRLLADANIASINIGYTLVPKAHFPQQLLEIDSAIATVLKQHTQWPIDVNNIILAGDSAGANLVSTYAAAVTNPALAQQLGFQPALRTTQLKGMVLHSGVYDMAALYAARQHTPWLVNQGMQDVIGQFAGSQHPNTAQLNRMSALPWLTHDYPPVYLSASEEDVLTAGQSVPFVARLNALGVPVTARIFPKNHPEKLRHDFNFDMHFQASHTVLQESIRFIQRH